METKLRITGMTCAACSSRLEKVLGRVEGVEEAEVNLATNEARVIHSGLAEEVLEKAVESAGFKGESVQESELTIAVGGMTCASCVARVEKALRKVPGVEDASVNLATNTAWVRGAGVLEADIYEAVSNTGFVPSAYTEPKQTQDRRPTDLIVAATLTVPIFLLSMFWHPRPEWANWLLMALTTPVVFWTGRGFFVRAIQNLRHGGANMDTLIAMGTLASWGYSFYALIRYSGNAHHQSEHIYFEGAATIVTLILVGKFLESRAKGSASDAIAKLLALRPRTAIRLTEGREEEVPCEMIRPGDQLRLKPGERVAVDGEVALGESYIDEAMLTGEPLPVQKKPGDAITAGTVNTSGSLVYVARKVGADTVLAHIVKLVEHAQGSKAPVQKLADRVSAIFVPTVIGIAVLTFLAYSLMGKEGWLPAVSILVVACPCALGLATPSALMVGVGRGSQLGLLIRDGASLEQVAKVQTVVLDKTGTITIGKPTVVSTTTAPGFDERETMLIAGAVERLSEHPIAKAVVAKAIEFGEIPEATQFKAHAGFGAEAAVRGKSVLVGSAEFLRQQGVPTKQDEGVEVAIDGKLAMCLVVRDPIGEHSKEAVSGLRAMGLEVVMLSGDQQATAAEIAREVGIEQFVAGVRPDGKAAVIKDLQANGKVVAMVGDGMNDAPALAQADLGIAMGGGTDVAIEAAGITLLGTDLRGAPNAIGLARAMLSTIRWNLAWAFGYNVIMIPLAITGLLNPMIAAAAMALSSVTVVSNSLRLKNYRPTR